MGAVPRRSASKNALGRSNEPPVLILTSLAEGPKHGYALTKDIEQFAGVTRGLIEPDFSGTDERRRPYRITAAGRAALEAAVRDMRTLADEGAARLGLGGRARAWVRAPKRTPRGAGATRTLGATS